MMTAIRYISDNNAHYLFFFFYGCADHRDLHSFPTRRSSDLVPMTNVWHHRPDIDRDVAAIFDPFGNAVHTALSFDLLGEDVLITGAGPIGIMGAAVAKHAGARYVVITDVNDHRLALAKQMGATVAVN